MFSWWRRQWFGPTHDTLCKALPGSATGRRCRTELGHWTYHSEGARWGHELYPFGIDILAQDRDEQEQAEQKDIQQAVTDSSATLGRPFRPLVKPCWIRTWSCGVNETTQRGPDSGHVPRNRPAEESPLHPCCFDGKAQPSGETR